ncbi:MoaD/ThiS family protein [uncultured Microbacterium sp.]|jgi:molybdopterin converting factor small subunit|uniref:MoaD/ThiS family protein n=1 Tax=uncultured Microbacterium sp. TaxID=191216 RepID=UPI0026087CF5|nr:MoaD/ThiS family protein [uncultured Microbacterium sp.]
MAQVRFFAAAEEAVGSSQLTVDAATLAALTAALRDDHPKLAEILPRCSVLVDGARVDDSWPLGGDAVVDVLPPFAGG